MSNSIEEAIERQIQEKSQASLGSLYEILITGQLLVPLFSELTKNASGPTDVPVRCLRLPSGEQCIPAFTSVARLLEWKKEGSLYAEMRGATLFRMATDMPEIDCVFVNYSEQQGTPKGKVTRPEFCLLADGVLPSNA